MRAKSNGVIGMAVILALALASPVVSQEKKADEPAKGKPKVEKRPRPRKFPAISACSTPKRTI